MKKFIVSLVLGMSLFTFAYWFSLFDLFNIDLNKLSVFWDEINSSTQLQNTVESNQKIQINRSGNNNLNSNQNNYSNNINSYSVSLDNDNIEIDIVSNDPSKLEKLNNEIIKYCKTNNLTYHKTNIPSWWKYSISWDGVQDDIDDFNEIVFWDSLPFESDTWYDSDISEFDPFSWMKEFEKKLEKEFEENDFSIPLPVPQKSQIDSKPIKI